MPAASAMPELSPSATPEASATATVAGPTAIPTAVAFALPKLERFVITFWVTPIINEESLEQIADGGFSLVMISPVAPKRGLRLMDIAHGLGLQVMLTDQVISPFRIDLRGDLETFTSAYKDHPAFWGYYLTDEPAAEDFAGLATLNRTLLELDPQHLPYINLFPIYATSGALGTSDYDTYLRTFIETVRPAILSYDYYIFLKAGDRQDYFTNLEAARREALRAEIPFMQIIQANEHMSYRDVDAADLRWQVYTTLAYGAKGISYFTYAVPPVDSFGDGLLDRSGQPTAKWGYAREINLEVTQLGEHLIGLTSTGVFFTDPPKSPCQSLAASELVAQAEGGKLQLGEFRDEAGGRWLMVVNLDRSAQARATLVLKPGITAVQQVNRGNGELEAVTCAADATCGPSDAGYALTLTLAPVDGVLLKLN